MCTDSKFEITVHVFYFPADFNNIQSKLQQNFNKFSVTMSVPVYIKEQRTLNVYQAAHKTSGTFTLAVDHTYTT